MAAPSGSSQVQTVPCWQEIVQATVVLPVLLSQQAFLLLMFPVHAQTDFFAIGEQFAAFHESPKLDVGAAVQVRQQSVYGAELCFPFIHDASPFCFYEFDYAAASK